MKEASKNLFYVLSVFLFSFCELHDIDITDTSAEKAIKTIPVTIAKWFNNHTAALCIDNDAGSIASLPEQRVQQIVNNNKLTIDYEFVTDLYRTDSLRLNYFFNKYLPLGFGYYGHGDTHINHDLLSEEESYQSFKKCYDTMIEFGLKPVSYAYPGGFGHLLRTQRALKRSGFLSGRRFEKLDVFDPYIMPDDKTEPDNWFELPSLVMQAYDYVSCSICINNTQDLIPHLDKTLKKHAWLILTYHSIGQHGSYGYYDFNDFKNDLLEIKKRDFWIAHNDEVTLYIYERNAASVSVKFYGSDDISDEDIEILISDGYDNNRFDIPLTLLFDLPDNWLRRKLQVVQDTVIIGEYEFEKNPVKISLLPNEEKYMMKVWQK